MQVCFPEQEQGRKDTVDYQLVKYACVINEIKNYRSYCVAGYVATVHKSITKPLNILYWEYSLV